MKLRSIHVQNYRSLLNTNEFPIKNLFAIVGENNSGKSNILRSIEILTSAGAGGVVKKDFFDPTQTIKIRATFCELTKTDKRNWQKYLVKDSLTIEKQISIETDSRTGKEKVSGEFHGYLAEPKDWFLSVPKIIEKFPKPDWSKIAKENKLPDYFHEDGKCNKTIFTKALSKFFDEVDVAYDEPNLSSTQALGLESNVVATLPQVYLLPAIADYSSEIDRRSTSTTFHKLMSDLARRIIAKDPKYHEVQEAIEKIKKLLNVEDGKDSTRLKALGTVEERISSLLQKMMPSIRGVTLTVVMDEVADIFSKGVGISIDDGVLTEVLAKGNGLQRCIVFTLLQTLILNEKGELFNKKDDKTKSDGAAQTSIILAIEEPELYIHPQLAKLIFDVLQEFSKTDQVIYTTHSPTYIDPAQYENISIVSKTDPKAGTVVKTCDLSAFKDLKDRKLFQGLARVSPEASELFFARRVLLVEGIEDLIAVTATLEKHKKINVRTEEIDWTVIICGGKPGIPFFQRLLNAFGIKYSVLHDVDIHSQMKKSDMEVNERQNNEIKLLAGKMPVHTFPIKLEHTIGLSSHLSDRYHAHEFFSDPARITKDLEAIILPIFN